MQNFLSLQWFMPIWGLFIQLCHYLKFYKPLVWVTLYFCDYKRKNTQSDKTLLLALHPGRFREDLDILKQTEKFEILCLPHFWMCRVIGAFFKRDITFDSVFKPNAEDLKSHENLKDFMAQFLPLLYQKTGVQACISAALHYPFDYLWGSSSSAHQVAFIVLHRECFMASQNRQRFWIHKWAGARISGHDLVITHNQVSRQVFIDAKVVPAERIQALGALRMDAFIKKYHQRSTPLPAQKQVVLFSFVHGVGLAFEVPKWSKPGKKTGFAQMFDDVHASFARCAMQNPDVNFVIKTKWKKDWFDKIDECLHRSNLNRAAIKNLVYTSDANVPDLIEHSHIICGYGSTTLLEAGLVGNRTIIVPLLAEAQNPDNSDKIQLYDDIDCFETAKTQEQFEQMIQDSIKKPQRIETKIQGKRDLLFDQWISPLTADATEQYTAHILTTIENKRSIN